MCFLPPISRPTPDLPEQLFVTFKDGTRQRLLDRTLSFWRPWSLSTRLTPNFGVWRLWWWFMMIILPVFHLTCSYSPAHTQQPIWVVIFHGPCGGRWPVGVVVTRFLFRQPISFYYLLQLILWPRASFPHIPLSEHFSTKWKSSVAASDTKQIAPEKKY